MRPGHAADRACNGISLPYLKRVDILVNDAFYNTRKIITLLNTDMRRITTFRSTTDRIYDGGPIRL